MSLHASIFQFIILVSRIGDSDRTARPGLSPILETQLDMTVLTDVYDSVDPLRHWENSGRGGCPWHMLPLFEQCCENMISNAQLVHHPNRHRLFNVLWLAERPHEVVLPESRAI